MVSMQGEGATHDKIYMVLYTIFTERVPLSYTFYWKYYPAIIRPTYSEYESLRQKVFMSF